MKLIYSSIFISNCSVKNTELCLKPHNFKLLPLLWISRIYKCVKEKRVKRVRGDAVALSTTYTLIRIRIKEWYSGPLCHKTNALSSRYVKPLCKEHTYSLWLKGYLTELQNIKENKKFGWHKPFLGNHQTAAKPKVIRHHESKKKSHSDFVWNQYLKIDNANWCSSHYSNFSLGPLKKNPRQSFCNHATTVQHKRCKQTT